MGQASVFQAEAAGRDRRAASLEQLASQIEGEAASLGGRLDGVLALLTDDVWRGPAAERAVGRLRSGRARLEATSDELRKVAALLRRRASDAQAEAGDLRRRAAMAASVSASTPLTA